jgi:glyoxylase-like metal-dependent hydrolase (beta-lactamase superfamily II)
MKRLIYLFLTLFIVSCSGGGDGGDGGSGGGDGGGGGPTPQPPVPLFRNAKYWSNKNHWGWATNPNSREKASFLKENLIPIEESGQLCFLDVKSSGFNHYEELGFDVMFVDGHTEKQMIPKVSYNGKEVVFMADLLPTAGHIPLPYIMGYDVRPLTTLEEKKSFLSLAVKDEYCLFMEHDAHNQIITLKNTEKGIRFGDSLSLKYL